MERIIIVATMALLVVVLGHCNKSHAADNIITVEQIGDQNSVRVLQDGGGHTLNIAMGKTSPVTTTSIDITQQGTGAKTATIDMPSGYNNSIMLLQDGAGNHTANLQNLTGAGNSFNISQTGAGTHSFTVQGQPGATSNGNIITATQSGGVGANKEFNLYMNGSTGARVDVQQTGTTPDQAGMAISCGNTCGSNPWSYIKY